MRIKDFIYEEDGVGVVEVILILVVMVALVLIFKTQINEIVKGILEKIKTDADTIKGGGE